MAELDLSSIESQKTELDLSSTEPVSQVPELDLSSMSTDRDWETKDLFLIRC